MKWLWPHILTLSLAAPALGQAVLQMPDAAVPALDEGEGLGSYVLPVGPYADGLLPSQTLSGAVSRQVWRIDDFQASTGVLLAVLTGQLDEAGFEEVFSCASQSCGGFDFRFALDLAPEPEMHVNLADYSYYAAMRDGEAGSEHVALVVSQGGGSGYVQIVHVAPPGDLSGEVTLSSRTPELAAESRYDPGTLAETLQLQSRAPLDGVVFEYGSTTLNDPELPSLQELAAYLIDNPELTIVLVGHTDAEGGLDSNINVSRARARAVRSVLIETYGIDGNRIDAQGVGYLMPLAPNSTQEGRDLNRRVEVVVLNTE